MPLLVIGNRTGIRPRAAGAVVDDDKDNVDDDWEEDVGDEDDYSKQRGDVTQIAICRHWSEEWEQNPPVRGQQILQVNSSLQ